MAFLVLENRGFTITDTVEEIQKQITDGCEYFYVNEKISFYGEMSQLEKISYQKVLINKRYIVEVRP